MAVSLKHQPTGEMANNQLESSAELVTGSAQLESYEHYITIQSESSSSAVAERII